MNPKRHLVIHEAALGDFVLLFPLLRRLEGVTTVASSVSKAALAWRIIPGIQTMSIDQLYKARPSNKILETLDAIDGYVIWFAAAGNSDEFMGRLVARLTEMSPKALHVMIDPKPPADWKGHVTQWHESQCERLGIVLSQQPSNAKDPAIAISRSHESSSFRRILLHPGAGSAAKRWPRERFVELAEKLRERGWDLRVLIGMDDLDMAGAEKQDLKDLVKRFDGRILQSLEELYVELLMGSILVGNDSGPAHLAAQLEQGVVSLFGPTNPAVWRPIGPGVRVVAPDQPREMQWLSVERVLEEIRGLAESDYFPTHNRNPNSSPNSFGAI